MQPVVSSLNDETEKKILRFFTKPVRFHLLYKSTLNTSNVSNLLSKFDNGMFIIVVFLKSGAVRGGFMSKALINSGEIADTDAFVFEINKNNEKRFRVLDSSQAVKVSFNQPSNSWSTTVTDNIYFGSCLQLYSENYNWHANFGTDITYNTGWDIENQLSVDVELHRVHELEDVLGSPWREVHWTEGTMDSLRMKFVTTKLKLELLSRVKVLLLGPVGCGKSSLVNSIRSTMYKRVVHLPIVGSAKGAFTKKLTSYDIRAEKGGAPTALSLCDVMGIGDENIAGLALSDALAVIRGHVPEGYKFQTEDPISDKVSGYRATPSLEEQVHCVAFILDASKVELYSSSLRSTIRELHIATSNLGVPQLVLLTHVDQVCPEEDMKYVYSSRTVRDKMQNAAELVGLPLSYVLPVKNYISQLSVDYKTDILLLNVVNIILQAVDDSFEDQYPTGIVEFSSTVLPNVCSGPQKNEKCP